MTRKKNDVQKKKQQTRSPSLEPVESPPVLKEGGALVCRTVMKEDTKRKQAEEQLKSQLEELQRWQDVMLDREDYVQELKREVNELCRRLGETVRYPSQEADSSDSKEVNL